MTVDPLWDTEEARAIRLTLRTLLALATYLDPAASGEDAAEAFASVTDLAHEVAALVAKLDGPSPGDWWAEQDRKRRSEPFISTDRSPRYRRVVIDGVKVPVGDPLPQDKR